MQRPKIQDWGLGQSPALIVSTITRFKDFSNLVTYLIGDCLSAG